MFTFIHAPMLFMQLGMFTLLKLQLHISSLLIYVSPTEYNLILIVSYSAVVKLLQASKRLAITTFAPQSHYCALIYVCEVWHRSLLLCLNLSNPIPQLSAPALYPAGCIRHFCGRISQLGTIVACPNIFFHHYNVAMQFLQMPN